MASPPGGPETSQLIPTLSFSRSAFCPAMTISVREPDTPASTSLPSASFSFSLARPSHSAIVPLAGGAVFFLFQRGLQHGDDFRLLVERLLDQLQDFVAIGRIDRALELLGLGLQFLVFHRFLVGVAQGGETVGRNIGRAGGEAGDVALRLDQRDDGLGRRDP